MLERIATSKISHQPHHFFRCLYNSHVASIFIQVIGLLRVSSYTANHSSHQFILHGVAIPSQLFLTQTGLLTHVNASRISARVAGAKVFQSFNAFLLIVTRDSKGWSLVGVIGGQNLMFSVGSSWREMEKSDP